jgi:hypothetical protein
MNPLCAAPSFSGEAETCSRSAMEGNCKFIFNNALFTFTSLYSHLCSSDRHTSSRAPFRLEIYGLYHTCTLDKRCGDAKHGTVCVKISTFSFWAAIAQSVYRRAKGWTGSISHRGKIFLFYATSRPALRPIQPLIRWVPRAISMGVEGPGREADHSPPSSAEVKNGGAVPLLSHTVFTAWCSIN